MPTYVDSTRAALAYLKVHFPSLQSDHADLVQDAWIALLAKGRTPDDVEPVLLLKYAKNLARNAKQSIDDRGDHVSFDVVFGDPEEV